MPALEKPLYRFAGFELDPGERRLLANGEAVALTPKVFDTLLLLVERAGHAVSKDTLMSTLWPRGFVDESNLTKHIWLIRKALGENEHEGRFIETVPKLGYRFVAAVEEIAAGVPARMRTIGSTAARADDTAVAPGAFDPTRNEAALSEGGSIDEHALAQTDAASDLARAPSANVTAVPSQTPTAFSPLPTPMPAHADHTRSRRRATALLAVTLAAVSALAWWQPWRSASAPATAGADSGGVAIVEFNNLSQNAKDAWLAPALAEMMATELAAGGNVHALPDELVRPARADLAVPLAGGYAAQSLATLRKRLGADYVLSGSYLVSGAGDEAALRVDLALQDARSGTALASVSRSAEVAELPALVTQAGAALRMKLGAAEGAGADLARTARAQPPTADVARRIGFALDALARHDPARARDELLGAVADAPDYAPAYSYLARAWSELGYKTKALAAAKQAAANDAGLPQLQRLEIEAQLHEAEFHWPQAIATLRELAAARSQDPEVRMRLIDALLGAGRPDEAASELAGLAAFASLHEDPRVELLAARVADAKADPKSAAAHARRALTLALAREAAGLAAEAKLHLALEQGALGEQKEAEAMLRESIADYRRIDHPHGEAYARQNLANLLVDVDRVPAAREEYERALAMYQRIGDQGGVAAVYSNLARMLWSAGDREGTEAAARRSLDIRRETGDLEGQAWNLTALATLHADESASDDVLDEYRQAIAIDEQTGNHTHHVFALLSYGDTLRARGQLDDAHATCAQAQSEAAAVADPATGVNVTFQCALIAVDRGELADARSGIERARDTASTLGDSVTPPNAELALGQIDVGQGNWKSAQAHLQHSIDGFSKAEFITGEAVAQALTALCAQALGDAAASTRAAARAADLRVRISERQEMFATDLALALQRGRAGDRANALVALRALAADAEQRHWLANALEAKLAAIALAEKPADAAALRDDVRAQAQAHGFKWVLARLDKPAQAANGAPHA